MDDIELNCTPEEAIELIKKALDEAKRKTEEMRESITLTREEMEIPYYAR